MKSPYEILIPDEPRQRLADYEGDLASRAVTPGQQLATQLTANDDFLTALLRTKLPQIFAESAVAGDGGDWTLTELALLGDISVAMDVKAPSTGKAKTWHKDHGQILEEEV